MRKTLVIAVREFQAAVHTKTFIISLLIMPLMGSAGLVAALLLKDQVNLEDKTVAVIDRTGVLFDDLAAAADAHNRIDIFTDPGSGRRGSIQRRPRFVLRRVDVATRDINTVRAELSDGVRSGALTAFVEIDAAALRAGDDAGRSSHIAYHSNNPMYRGFLFWFSRQVNQCARTWRAREAGLSPQSVERVTQHLAVDERPLYSRTPGGTVEAGRAHEHTINIAAGVGLSLLMFLVILVGAIPLTYSVLEEKMQRSAEVLLGTVTPFQFMMGKILGMVAVSMGIVTIYIVVGFIAASAGGYGRAIPRHLINWFVLYQAGAILMFGSLYAAIGAACNDMKDAQNLMAPASLIACIPLFVIRPVMLEPNSTFSTWVSFFPPATPMLMILRQGLPATVPLWQPIVGLLLVLVTAVLCVALAARVFRVGILMQGKGASLKELLQWATYGMGHRAPRRERRGTSARQFS